MTDTNAAPTKKNVLSLFNAAIEPSAAPPTKAEIERARRVDSVESALVNLRDVFVENGLADGDGAKSSQVASTLQSLHKKSLAAIASIPDSVLDPEAAPVAPKTPRKPRETKTATLSDADKAAAVERALVVDESRISDSAAGTIAAVAPPASEVPKSEATHELPTKAEVQEAIAMPAARVAPQRPPLSRPIPADAPNTDADPRGATDPNADDEGF